MLRKALRNRLKGEQGQMLVLVALALPLFFSVCLFLIDGSRLFVAKRATQNAADAASLAAARELNDTDTSCTGDDQTPGTCMYNVRTFAQTYAIDNGWTGTTLHACASGSDTDCYKTPYPDSSTGNRKVQIRLSSTATTFFSGVVSALGDAVASVFHPSARAAASKAPVTELHCWLGGVQRDDLLPSCMIPGTPGTGTFAYAAGTSCSALTVTTGGDNFRDGALWSNGGINATGANDTVKSYRLGNTAHCAGDPQLVDAGGQTTPPPAYTGPAVTPTYVPTRAAGDWPVALPAIPSACSANGTGPGGISAGTNNINNASWLATHPAGVYCWTGTVTIATSGGTFGGYEFVSKATNSNAIAVQGSGQTFTGAGDPKVVFFATVGGVAVNNPITLDGGIFAPNSSVVFTGSNNTQTGMIEAQTITINNGPQTFVGTGPGQGGTPDQNGSILPTVVGANLSIDE